MPVRGLPMKRPSDSRRLSWSAGNPQINSGNGHSALDFFGIGDHNVGTSWRAEFVNHKML